MWLNGWSVWYSNHSPWQAMSETWSVGRAGSLGKSSSVYQVSDVVGLIQQDRLREVLPVHHGGIVACPVCSGTKPRHALLEGHSLWD